MYTVVEAKNPKALEIQVGAMIRDGWRPQGGVAVVRSEMGEITFFQAMTISKP